MLGTDRLGRDTLSRLVYGAPIFLAVSLVGILLTGVVGTAIGLVAGFWGGWVDTLCMRLVDISLSLPGILMAVLLSVVFKPSFKNVVIVVIFLLWPSYARLVRGETLGLKQQEFVALARVAGCSSLTIMCRHLLPNLAPSNLVLATLQVGFVIVLEASLSFIGVGIPPPTPSWGVMVADGRGLIEQAWWISILPGLAILVTVISLNILGNWVRDRLDPSSGGGRRQRGRGVVRGAGFTDVHLHPPWGGASGQWRQLCLQRGETLGIVGESGSGKSMTCLSIMRLLPEPGGRIVGGEILFNGEDLLRKSAEEMRQIRGAQIAMILQDPMASLNPAFTVGTQIAEPLRLHRGLRGREVRTRVDRVAAAGRY